MIITTDRKAVIVQGWPLPVPAADEAPLREALTRALAIYGRIASLAFTDEQRVAAVVVFEEEAAAARAVQCVGPILGATVVVKPELPSAGVAMTGAAIPLLPPPTAPAAAAEEEEEERLLGAVGAIGREEETGGAAAALPVLAERAADVFGSALAETVLLAQRGLQTAKELDGKVGVTRRLHTLDEEKGLSRQAKAAAETLSTRAQAIDEQLKLSEGLRDTADRAKETAAVLSGRAQYLSERMLRQNPKLAEGAQKTGRLLGLAEAWGKRTLERAKQEIVSRGGVVPGSARGDVGGGGVDSLMREYEPLVASDAGAGARAGDEDALLSPGEEEVPIQL